MPKNKQPSTNSNQVVIGGISQKANNNNFNKRPQCSGQKIDVAKIGETSHPGHQQKPRTDRRQNVNINQTSITTNFNNGQPFTKPKGDFSKKHKPDVAKVGGTNHTGHHYRPHSGQRKQAVYINQTSIINNFNGKPSTSKHGTDTAATCQGQIVRTVKVNDLNESHQPNNGRRKGNRGPKTSGSLQIEGACRPSSGQPVNSSQTRVKVSENAAKHDQGPTYRVQIQEITTKTRTLDIKM